MQLRVQRVFSPVLSYLVEVKELIRAPLVLLLSCQQAGVGAWWSRVLSQTTIVANVDFRDLSSVSAGITVSNVCPWQINSTYH